MSAQERRAMASLIRTVQAERQRAECPCARGLAQVLEEGLAELLEAGPKPGTEETE